MSEEENWRPVAGYEGFYDVSDLGRVRCWWSGSRRRVRVDQPRVVPAYPAGPTRAYLYVKLYREGACSSKAVHKLVIRAFGPPQPIGHECAHDDGNSTHNRATNLIWKTRAENHADKKRHGTQQRGATHPMAKITEAQAREILASPNASTGVLARRLGITPGHVWNIRTGKAWSHLTKEAA